LKGKQVCSTQTYGIDPDWVEAMAFAWFAHQTMQGLTSNLPSVTGASHPVKLGGIYPA
jgi:anhydro-N-acetylmuramic acid kinase